MLLFVVIFGALVAVAVLPLMFTARALGAQRTGFWWALLVLLLQGALALASNELVSSELVAFALAFLAGALVIKAIFGTTYPKALLIGVVSTLLTLLGQLVLIKLLSKLLDGGHPAMDATVALAADAFRYLA